MKDDRSWALKQIKEHNRGKILKLLGNSPMRFTDLQKETKFSPRGLTSMLKDLISDKKIEKTLNEGKASYKITKKGMVSFKDLSEIGSAIEQIQKKGGSYHQGYSNVHDSMLFYRLPWGVQDELALDKKIGEKLNPFTKEFVMDVQQYMFKKLHKDFKNKKLYFDKTVDGNMVLGFIINYKELAESIETNSLEQCNHIPDEDLEVFEKFELGTFTGEDVKKYAEIMERRNTRKVK